MLGDRARAYRNGEAAAGAQRRKPKYQEGRTPLSQAAE